MTSKVVLITGASSGMGMETALRLHENGYKVYAAARRIDRMQNLKNKGISVIEIDVTKDDTMISAIEKINKESGKIDILINNAGYGSYGALEDVPIDEGRYQFEVNVFGLARLTQLVLPKMREAKSGTIINVSSVGGKFGEACGSWYHASKYAVEGLSDSLALEVEKFGIKVIVVEPGPIITEWGDIAADSLIKMSGNTAYGDIAKKRADILRKINKDSNFGSPATVIADTMMEAIKATNPKDRYPSGRGAKALMLMRKFMSNRSFYKLLDRLT